MLPRWNDACEIERVHRVGYDVSPLRVRGGANTSAWLGSFSATDRLALATVAVIAAVACATAQEPALPLLGAGALACVLVALSRGAKASPWGRVLHDFAPVIFVAWAFKLVGFVVVAANPARWDAALAAADLRYFGWLAQPWRSLLGRPAWLTDLASIAYVSFHVVPIVIGALLYSRRRVFESYALVLEATFIATWVGYFAFPAFGPRIPAPLADRALGGSFISDSVRAALGLFEGEMLDAFPSGHVAVSLVYVAYAWKYLPRLRAPLVFVEVALIFSTVYLSLHYVVDLVGGGLVAAAVATWVIGRRPSHR